MSYLKGLVTRRVPQRAPIPRSGQVPNDDTATPQLISDFVRGSL